MIIGLDLEENAFEQDVRELLMAFYPGCRFVYGTREEAESRCLEDGGLDLMVSGHFLEEAGERRYQLTVERQKADEAKADSGADREKDGTKEREEQSQVIQKGLMEARENQPFAVTEGDRAETKNRIKRRLYFLLMLDTGRHLP